MKSTERGHVQTASNCAWAPSCGRSASTPAPWRYPSALADANFNFPAHPSLRPDPGARPPFDAFFMADHLAVLNMPVGGAEAPSHTVTSFEPFTLLSALAGATERIGLVAWDESPPTWAAGRLKSAGAIPCGPYLAAASSLPAGMSPAPPLSLPRPPPLRF